MASAFSVTSLSTSNKKVMLCIHNYNKFYKRYYSQYNNNRQNMVFRYSIVTSVYSTTTASPSWTSDLRIRLWAPGSPSGVACCRRCPVSPSAAGCGGVGGTVVVGCVVGCGGSSAVGSCPQCCLGVAAVVGS